MRRSVFSWITVACAALFAALVPALPAVAADGRAGPGSQHRTGVLLRAELVGSLANDPTLFGVVPGTNDWSVSNSDVVVSKNGRFEARIRGLILTGEGANLLPLISASLLCNGIIVGRTDPAAFSANGNARISGQIAVPDRCLAPVVLINPLDRNGVYIAASGTMLQ